jgi:FkbM family methyltransferase
MADPSPQTSPQTSHPASPDERYFVAQHGEDRFINENWPLLGLPEQGFFVDVGACEGTHLNNTLWIERVKGWKGMCIEPDPRWAQGLRAKRPGAIIELCAAGRETKQCEFGLMEDPQYSGLARVSAPLKAMVQTATLTHLLDRHGIERVDLLSIDTEGSELEVWEGLDLNRWRPGLVIVEWCTTGLPDKRPEMLAQWMRDGYQQIAILGGNLLFLRNDLLEAACRVKWGVRARQPD